MELNQCCICGIDVWGLGKNPWPVVKEEGAVCCNMCDANVVLPARIRWVIEQDEE